MSSKEPQGRPPLSSEHDAQHQSERNEQGRNQKVGEPVPLGQALLQPLAFLVHFFLRQIEIPLCLVPRFGSLIEMVVDFSGGASGRSKPAVQSRIKPAGLRKIIGRRSRKAGTLADKST